MSSSGLMLISLSSVLTVCANLMVREGLLRAGGFGQSSNIASELVRLSMQPLFAVGLVLYASSALVWFKVISEESLSSSYPLLVALTFVLVTIGAWYFFREPISSMKLVGIAVILAGIGIVAQT